VRYVKVFFDDP